MLVSKSLALVPYAPHLTSEQFIKMHVEKSRVVDLVKTSKSQFAIARSSASLEKLTLSSDEAMKGIIIYPSFHIDLPIQGLFQSLRLSF